jgi:pimeloyl-ACP methyl ester carboxylesterase
MTALLVRSFGVLLLLTALAVALSRAPDRSAQSLVANWAQAPSDFIEVQGQVVHIRDEGPRHQGWQAVADPPPIVLLHGTGASLHTWEGWAQALRGQRRVIRFDLPGFGLTGPWSETFSATYPHDRYEGDAYARFTLALMDALQVQRAVLAGNSLGGEVAWRAAFLAPDRVAGLVLVDASGPRFQPVELPLGFRIARMPVANRLMEALLPRSLVAQSVAAVYGDPTKVTPLLVDRYFELTLREGNRRALATRLQFLADGADAERIATLKLPTLILWGGRDRLIPVSTAQLFQQQIVGSRLVIFDALGHVPQEEDPSATVVPVRDFLGLTPNAAAATSAAAKGQ